MGYLFIYLFHSYHQKDLCEIEELLFCLYLCLLLSFTCLIHCSLLSRKLN
uniref:Uncharacterized protein n=1 Tax=Populus trichocarpa TaxID=3694 RepID=A0A3N7EZQ3_POPTR